MSETPKLAVSHSSARTFTGWSIFFFVVLRIAIGWHFFYEGAWKLVKEEDWKATPYLLTSAGPFRDTFRWMVEDPDGLKRLTEETAKARLDDRYTLLVKHYGLTEEQLKGKPNKDSGKLEGGAEEFMKDKISAPVGSIEAIFADPNFQSQLEDYKTFLAEIKPQEKAVHNPWARGTDYNRERVVYDYGKKAKALAALLTQVEEPMNQVEWFITGKLEKGHWGILSEEQLAKGPIPHEDSQTELIDWMNMISLTLVGACLMLGLFTRLAAVGGIGLLAMFYFAMPPWPGLPETPMSEGHYLIINKNAVEAIALMAIATSRIGRWGGLDGIIAAIRSRGSQNDVELGEPAGEVRQTQYV